MLSFLLNRPIVTSVLAAGLLVGVAGVNTRPNTNQAVPLPDGVVIFGAEHLVLEQGTNVLSGDTASNKTAVVQRESLLIGSLLADRATLGFGARILGNLEADKIVGPNFIVEGETISPRVTDDFAIPDLPAFTTGTENIRIRAGEIATLQPGAFNRITVEKDAIVTLQGGVYDLRSIQVGEGVVFNLTEPVTLNIQQRAAFGNRTVFNLDSELDLNDIRINFVGTGVVTFGRDTFAAGIVRAPNGTIFLHKDSTWRGEFAARRIGVGKESQLTVRRSFSPPLDLDTVVADGKDLFPVIQIGVLFTDDATTADVRFVEEFLGGRIIGFVPNPPDYLFEVPVATIAEHDTLIANLEAEALPFVDIVYRNSLTTLTTLR